MRSISIVLVLVIFCVGAAVNAGGQPAANVGLKDDPLANAKLMFQAKCASEAKEEIFLTAENVASFLRIDEYEPGRPFVGGIEIHHGPFGGESNTNPHWMFFRLGLDCIEYELHKSEREKSNMRYGHFDVHTRNSEPINSISSSYGIRFKSTATAAEEAIGIR